MTWSDIDALEMALLSLVPLPMLQREAWNLRARYRDIVGQEVYDAYLQSNPPRVGANSADPPPMGSPPGQKHCSALHHRKSPPVGESPPGSPPISSPPIGAALTASEDDVLRADLRTLLSEIQWALSLLAGARENA